MKKSRGFTIVELLIVIVVIGILAAITIVAYNGVQQRAKNTSRVSTANEMVKAVKIALVGTDPATIEDALNDPDNNPLGWHRACLGTGYSGAACAQYQSQPPYVTESSTLNNILKSAGSLPSIQGYPAAKSTDGDVVAGPFLGTAWVDSKDMLIMEYSLDGEQQDCKLRPLVFKNGSNETLTPPGNSTYITTGDGVTGCEVVIVDSYTPNN